MVTQDLTRIAAKGGTYRLFSEVRFTEAPRRVPLMPKPGTYQHPSYGSIALTAARITRFVANVNNRIYQRHIPVDAEHQPKLSGALGYIERAEINADGSADAIVNWEERGKSLIASGGFKYVSPEWYDAWTDPANQARHEDVVIGLALTTRPFFKDGSLRPLVAREGVLQMGTTTATPPRRYTMAEARAQATAERDACWSVIERKASEIQGPRKLTKEQAITAVLNEERGLYHRFRELDNIDHRADLTLRAMSEDTAWQETEAIRVERDKAKADDYKPVNAIDKKIHEAALAIMEKHGITYDSARYHVLERNPDWRLELALESPLLAQPSTMVYSETLNDLDAEIGTAAVLYQRAHPGTTYAVAYTEAMQASADFRRRYVALSRGVAA